MTVPALDLSGQHEALLPQMLDAFRSAVASGRFILGQSVATFEATLAQYCGVEAAVGVSSGTDALLAALMALQIGPGDEVITTPFTFFATAACIVRVGATPVFVDIDAETFNLDPAAIEAAVTDRSRAIIAVHLYGQTSAMDAITACAARHELKVIEDAAQAMGAEDASRRAGAMGAVGCFSFYPTKGLAALGDAGACVTNDPALAERIRALRVHGDLGRYQHRYMGGNFRIDALQAAMLSIKFPHLNDWNEQRRSIAKRYTELLAPLPLGLPREMAGRRHVYNLYTIRVPDGRRGALAEHLTSAGIGYGIHYPIPLYLQPCMAALGIKAGACPVAERAADEVLSLPIYPGLTRQQQDEVVDALQRFFA
jgi:dTDP-4-amino-4,6-dideoxygalactose transaminase